MVTAAELAGYFEQLLGSIERLSMNVRGAIEKETNKRYLNRKEAAEYVCVRVAKLDKLATKGVIRKAKFGCGKSATVVYRREDLDEFVEIHVG